MPVLALPRIANPDPALPALPVRASLHYSMPHLPRLYAPCLAEQPHA